jgi:Xaa-Pro dipeptidase
MIDQLPSWNETENTYLSRQRRLGEVLLESRLDGLALNPGPSLTYLMGLNFHLSERPVVGFFKPGFPPVLVLPELEAAKLDNLSYPCRSFLYGEDPAKWLEIFSNGIREAGLTRHVVGVESRRMRVLEFHLLESAAAETKFKPADDAITALRIRKDPGEADAMRTAVRIAQDALLLTLQSFALGMTERELSAELTLQLLRQGSDSEFPFPPIVSAGENSANPHATPSDRPIQTGDLLVIDWGATYKGYISDLTRTFAIEPVAEEFDKIAGLVVQANAAGRTACRPGVSAELVDRAARDVVEQAGYGRNFFHRTGHGIGMESHEDPYIRTGNPLALQPGMCFTIEPGIYLSGRGGVRVEDNVMITEEGVECFSNLPRELKSLPV